jgi:hypothetical protein
MMDDHHSISLTADRALFQGEVQGLAVAFYQNERPPLGLCGLIDWHFQGALSRSIQMGAMRGEVGECIYFPFTRNDSIYHLILLGAGHSSTPGIRKALPTESLRVLHQNLKSLRIPKVGISRSDFGHPVSDAFLKYLKGVPLWIAP